MQQGYQPSLADGDQGRPGGFGYSGGQLFVARYGRRRVDVTQGQGDYGGAGRHGLRVVQCDDLARVGKGGEQRPGTTLRGTA